MACLHQGKDVLMVIDVKSIFSVIAMVPFKFTINGRSNYYFVVEKVGLEVVEVDVDTGEDAV
jgi:hypothetical protein